LPILEGRMRFASEMLLQPRGSEELGLPLIWSHLLEECMRTDSRICRAA
jgi:hypothetical protein